VGERTVGFTVGCLQRQLKIESGRHGKEFRGCSAARIYVFQHNCVVSIFGQRVRLEALDT